MPSMLNIVHSSHTTQRSSARSARFQDTPCQRTKEHSEHRKRNQQLSVPANLLCWRATTTRPRHNTEVQRGTVGVCVACAKEKNRPHPEYWVSGAVPAVRDGWPGHMPGPDMRAGHTQRSVTLACGQRVIVAARGAQLHCLEPCLRASGEDPNPKPMKQLPST